MQTLSHNQTEEMFLVLTRIGKQKLYFEFFSVKEL